MVTGKTTDLLRKPLFTKEFQIATKGTSSRWKAVSPDTITHLGLDMVWNIKSRTTRRCVEFNSALDELNEQITCSDLG